jgi:hypothetical protein
MNVRKMGLLMTNWFNERAAKKCAFSDSNSLRKIYNVGELQFGWEIGERKVQCIPLH